MSNKETSVKGHSTTLLIIIALWVMANSGYFPELWGISYLTFLPSWWTLATIAIVLFLAIPSVAGTTIGWLEQSSEWLHEDPKRKVLALSVSSIVFVALASMFQQSIPLLGDGSLRANEIFDGRMWQPTEMLDFLIHSLLYKHIFAPMGLSATSCYRAISIVCGPLFLINVWVLANYIDARNSVSIFLLLSTSGMVILFFGYVESYSIVAAYIPLLILWQIKASEKKLHWSLALLAYLFGGLIHSIVLLLFAAPMLYILLSHRTVEPRDIKTVHKVMAVVVIVGVFFGFIVSSIEDSRFSNYLLPLLKNGGAKQALLTSQHALNILNWLFFAALPFLLLLPELLWKKPTAEVTPPAKGMAYWLCISALLFIFLFRPQIGGPRDWDLFSLAAFCLIPAAIVIHKSKWKNYTPSQIIPALFLSASLVVSLVIINSSPLKSVERFTEIIEVSKSGNLYIEYSTLFNYADSYTELAHRRSEFGRRAWEQPARTRQDSLFITQSLALQYLTEGDHKEAKRWISRALETDSTNLFTYKILVQIYERAGDNMRLVAIAELLESIFAADADGLVQAGTIYMKQNRLEAAERPLRRAFELDQTNLSVVVNYGNYYSLIDHFDSAVVMFESARGIDASSFAAVFGLATALYNSGNKVAAKNALDNAEILARTTKEKERISYLRSFL